MPNACMHIVTAAVATVAAMAATDSAFILMKRFDNQRKWMHTSAEFQKFDRIERAGPGPLKLQPDRLECT